MDPGQMGQTPMTAEQLRALQNTLSPQQYAWLLKNLQQQQAQQQQAHAQQAMHQRQQGLLQQAQQAQQIQQAQAQQAQAQQAQQLLALQQRISQLPPEMQAQVQQQLRMQQHAQALQQRQQQQMQLQQGPGQHGQARSTPQQIMQMQQHQMQQRQLQIQRQQQLQMQQQRPQHLQLLQQQQQAQQQAQQLQHLNFHHPHSRPQGQPRALPPPSYPPPLRSGSGPVKRQRTYPKLPLPPLLPPMNTYAERLKKGDTGLLEPGLAQTSLSKRRGALARKSFREDSSSSEPESYSSSDEGEDQEEEEQDGQEENSDNENVSVQSRLQATKEREEDTSGLEKKEKRTLKLNLPPKERRAIRQTKHDYSRLYMARLPQLAATNEVLVPIRLDFEIDNLKLRDTFTWNLHEQLMTPDMFAEYLCLDLGFPQHMQSAISSSIQSQLSEYRTFLVSSDAPPSIDSRVPIILDLHVGKIYLRDRFEWDLSSTMTPEHFALILTQDLGLGSEFPALISHSIREQVFKLRSDGDVVFNPFALEARIRGEEEAQGWCPTVELMTLEELEKFDMGRERKSRAQRREQKLANRRKSGWSAADTVTNGPITSATTTNATTRVVSGSVHDEAMSSDNAKWICQHCCCPRSETSTLMPGLTGSPDALCETCGTYLDIHTELPDHRKDLFRYIPRA